MDKNTNKNSFIIFLLVAVLCGVFAGVFGEIVTRVYFLRDLSQYGELNLSDLNSGRSNLVIRDAKKVVVNQDVKVSESLAAIEPSVLKIFKKQAAKNKDGYPSYYSLSQPLFSSLAITADGWVAATVPAALKADLADNKDNYIAIGNDQKFYTIDRLANLKGAPENLILFKLSSASSLPVRRHALASDLSRGQMLLAVNRSGQVMFNYFSAVEKSEAVLSSDMPEYSLRLSQTLEEGFEDAAIFNLAGDLVALADGEGKLIPAFSLSAYWPEILNGQKTKTPYLGLYYINLGLNVLGAGKNQSGAMVYPNKDKISVIKDSPADKAGLKSGDIITWVDNQAVSAKSDLSDLISYYSPGDTVTISYIRNNEAKEAEIKLGELK